jgi:hypothetical protein
MIDFALIDGDISVDNNGNFIFVESAECVSQTIVTSLSLFIGEYEYNNILGISWKLAMEKGYTQLPLLQYQTQNTINAINDYIPNDNLKIKEILSYNSSFNENRKLNIDAEIKLIDGQVIGINTNV